ncbi:Smr/MutS family protein [Suttonella sp. R2A3]|uniref:Smr/MutS family protein n=1 Tax=Suttonella sp. R2A3 TaxID=2908648 RepID=UPI001F35F88C|nr:Smr/MutS family protein [Suttonella sp. R2A3]UJF25009.1 Smr/MutS family protein [Suttonella sp. R2A3]
MSKRDTFAELIGNVDNVKRSDTHPNFQRQAKVRIRKRRHRDPIVHRSFQRISHNFDRIDPRLFHAMQYNRITADRVIDLHGLHVDHALRVLQDALNERRNRHLSCWQIVHGKGNNSPHYDRAPLKHAVIELILNHSDIAAVCEIIDTDGRSGALVIALHPA